jgi:ATP-binding cassette subfamily B protein
MVLSSIVKHYLSLFRFPLVRQNDQADCGAASLLSVLKFYGGNTNLVNIRKMCQTDAQGSSMASIVKAAEQIGFDAHGATGEYDDLRKEQMPCIAHIILDDGRHHFVVIYKINEHAVWVADPGNGRYKLTRAEFCERWKHKAVILLSLQNGSLVSHETSSWFEWIWTYLKKEQSWIQQTLFLGLITTAFGLLISLFIRILIDQVIPEKDISKITYTGLFLLFLLIVRSSTGYFRERFFHLFLPFERLPKLTNRGAAPSPSYSDPTRAPPSSKTSFEL